MNSAGNPATTWSGSPSQRSPDAVNATCIATFPENGAAVVTRGISQSSSAPPVAVLAAVKMVNRACGCLLYARANRPWFRVAARTDRRGPGRWGVGSPPAGPGELPCLPRVRRHREPGGRVVVSHAHAPSPCGRNRRGRRAHKLPARAVRGAGLIHHGRGSCHMSSPAAGTAFSPDGMPRPPGREAHAQSLARGTAGIALLHIELARRGSGSWIDAHAALACCTRNLIASQDASLYFGAPAVAFALHTAAAGTGRYTGALHALYTKITQLTLRRVGQAHARIDRGERPRTGEFDLFYGLTGLGCYLLRRDPNTDVLREVLSYLVRLIMPLDGDKDQLPGWWTPFSPSGICCPTLKITILAAFTTPMKNRAFRVVSSGWCRCTWARCRNKGRFSAVIAVCGQAGAGNGAGADARGQLSVMSTGSLRHAAAFRHGHGNVP